ncbi:MAG: START-like domain-containing protein [Bacteroidales bacterium]|nr:START-like domain-containing protein [Bacteroidales bacterium]
MVKEKICLEYQFKNVSVSLLWSYLSTPSGLAKWFSDDVDVDGKMYTFTWQKAPQKAELIHIRQGHFVRFRWEEDSNTKYYFEFKLNTGELSGEVEIEVTDFCLSDEVEDTHELWNTQIEALKHTIGA